MRLPEIPSYNLKHSPLIEIYYQQENTLAMLLKYRILSNSSSSNAFELLPKVKERK
jgi:hypothetical protein